MTAYFVIAGILLVLWALGSVVTFFFGVDEMWDKEDWQFYAAVVTGLFFAFVLWPAVLPLALAAGLCYGVYSIFKVVGRAMRGEL